MSVTYTSPHHSEEDPGGLIREVLNLGDAFPGPAADILLSWSLRLDDSLPAAEAARRLLERYDLQAGEPPAGACGELVVLLRQAAEAPPPASGRRRGGWRSRRH
ncbi:MAG: hypothetical protein AAFY02_11425 [Pseudomonadota bacterium]